MDLSIVISLFNEAESLDELLERIHAELSEKQLKYEVIMVDDGSTDGSWEKICALKQTYGNVRGIRFRRNYGKSAALYCGFEAAEGDIVVTMDADLQDDPAEIPEMMRMIREEGYDLVSGWKKKRYDNALTKNIPSKIYNWAARKVTGIKLHDMNCGLKAYRKDVVKDIEVYGEMHRFIPYLAKNAGYEKIGEKVVKHQARKYGVSKFGMERFMNGFYAPFRRHRHPDVHCRLHMLRMAHSRETCPPEPRPQLPPGCRPAAVLRGHRVPAYRCDAVPDRIPCRAHFTQLRRAQQL